MRQGIRPLLYSSVIYIAVCLLVMLAIKPFSLINFVGPVAGITTAITLVWGTIAVISVITSTLLLLLVMTWYTDFDINIAIIILIYLAALLQSFWAKQLTAKLISKQKWISSRSLLISFIIKIGPLVGIVAAFCGVIVAILDNETFDTSLGFSFFRTWSASVLVSVFAIPALLFLQGDQKLNVSKRTFVIISSILGFIAIGLLFQISQQQQEHKRLDLYKYSLHEINDALKREVNNVQAEITAMAAYFNSSADVNIDEFNTFSNEVYKKSSSIRVLLWAPVVTVKEKHRFEQYASAQLNIEYNVISPDETNSIEQNDFTPIVPVFYIYPEFNNEDLYGFDLYNNASITSVLNYALKQQRTIASAPFSMKKMKELNPEIIIVQSVNNIKSKNLFGQLKSPSGEYISGFVSAMINIDKLVEKLMNNVTAKNISITIVDATEGESYILYGDKLSTKNRLQKSEFIEFFGREWQLQIVESSSWLSQGKSWQTWVMLFGGVVGGFTFQLLILMMAAYSIELSHKVAEKTRELIKANELSDKENQSKAHFLQMLTLELSAPIKLAERLTQQQLSDQNPQKLKQFSEVTEQLKHILMSVSDLSTIESRTHKLDQQTFDFSSFLSQIEQDFKERSTKGSTQIKFLFDCELPNFVVSDQKRLEKLLLALQDNILRLFADSDVQVSVKAHYHKDFATLFFTCSALSAQENMPIVSWLNKDIANFSTSMALATELVHILQGNIKLTLVPTGDAVMTISLPISINCQQSTLNTFEELNALQLTHKIKILLIEESLSTNFETTPLLLGLDYQVEIIDDYTELSNAINTLHFDMIIIDNITSKPYVKALEESLNQIDSRETPKVIGIYRGIEYRQMSPTFKQLMNECLLYPISAENLQTVLAKTHKSNN